MIVEHGKARRGEARLGVAGQGRARFVFLEALTASRCVKRIAAMVTKTQDKRRVEPELMKVKTTAALLDMAPSTWRYLYPTLAAYYGLKVYIVCGTRFRRENVLAVMDKLENKGLEVKVYKEKREVHIGDEIYHTTGAARIR